MKNQNNYHSRIPVEKNNQIVINSLSVVGPDGTRENCLTDGQPFTIKPKGGQIHKGIRRKYWKSAELSFGFEKDKSITVEIELQLNGKKLKKTILYKATETKRQSTLKNAFDAA